MTGRSGIGHWAAALSSVWNRSSTCCTLVSPTLSTALPISDGWTRSVDTSRHSSTVIKSRVGSHRSMSRPSRQRIQVVWDCGMTGSLPGPITRGSWPISCWPTWRHWRASGTIATAGGSGPRDSRFRWRLTPQADADVQALRAWTWLVWDLHFGRDPLPASARYLDPVDTALLERIRSLAVTDRVVAGLDFYPTSVFPVGGAAPEWSIHERVAFAVAEFRRWHDRYDVPFWVAETSNLSLGVDDQIPWLLSLTDGLRGLRNDGLPVRGTLLVQPGRPVRLADRTGESERRGDRGRALRRSPPGQTRCRTFAQLASQSRCDSAPSEPLGAEPSSPALVPTRPAGHHDAWAVEPEESGVRH
jgi:hypothetical protein